MPKKTRKEKIIAQLRRKLKAQKNISTSQKSQPEPESLPQKNAVETGLLDKKSTISTLNLNYTFVVSDLKKTLFISLFAISLELVLYYMLELGGYDKFAPLIANFTKIF